MEQWHRDTQANLVSTRDHIESIIGELASEIAGQASRAPGASAHDKLARLSALEGQLASTIRLVEHFRSIVENETR